MTAADAYEILDELGRGGHGRVVAARERASGRRVAIKFLTKIDPHLLQRFEREGHVTAALDHPGIVRVHARGVSGDRPFLVLELVEGARPLDEAFEHQTRSERVELIRDAARALGYAHAQGVVHRDVKPANVLVDGDGRVRVTDFGLAWTQDLERLTQSGALLGTPHYMSPEQIAGQREQLGPATDVWALGVVLYEALTGSRPFEGRSLPELAVRIASAEPTPPRVVDPSVSLQLEAVCLKALAPAPQDRYPDAAALAADLDACLTGSAVEAASGLRLLSRRTRRVFTRLVVAAVALIGVLIGLMVTQRPRPDPLSPEASPQTPAPAPTPTPAAFEPPELAKVPWRLAAVLPRAQGSGQATFVDANRLLTHGSGRGVFLWALEDPPRLVARWEVGARDVVIGPRRKRFYTAASGRGLFATGWIDEPERPISFHTLTVDGVELRLGGFAASSAGGKLLFAAGGEVDRASDQTATPVVLFELPPGASLARVVRRLEDHPGGVRFLSFSGDGRMLVTVSVPLSRSRFVSSTNAKSAACQARVFRVQDGAQVSVRPLPSRCFALAVNPRESSYAVSLRSAIGATYRAGRVWLCDAKRAQVVRRYVGTAALGDIPAAYLDTLESMLEELRPFAHRHGSRGLGFSPDGRWLLSLSGEDPTAGGLRVAGELRIWEVERASEYREPYRFDPRVVPTSLAIGPDGAWIAVGTRKHGVHLLRLISSAARPQVR